MDSKYLIILFALIILGCSREKSITEELSVNEMSSFIKQDTLYKDIIENVEFVRDLINSNKVFQATYLDLTYVNYYNYLKKATSKEFEEQVLKGLKEERKYKKDSLHLKYDHLLDSAISRSKFLLDSINLEQFCKIEYVGVNIVGEYITVKIKPLVKPIEKLQFAFFIDDDYHDEMFFYGEYFLSGFEDERDFRIYAENDDQKDALIILLEKRKYNPKVFTKISEVKFMGNSYSFFDLKIPATVYTRYDLDTVNIERWQDFSLLLRDFFLVPLFNNDDITYQYIKTKRREIDYLAYDFHDFILKKPE